MKTLIAVCALAASIGAAAADTSTTANVPTGYQVAGSTYYSLRQDGARWLVAQKKIPCTANQLFSGRYSDCMSSREGASAGDASGSTK